MSISESQMWADVVAMSEALNDDVDISLLPLLQQYIKVDTDDDMTVDLDLVQAMLIILSALMDATADHLEMSQQDLGIFILMEKFKRDLIDG